jgi:hypothetical protein
MNTLVDNRIRATTLDFTDDYLIVYLDDARVIQVPIIWFPSYIMLLLSSFATTIGSEEAPASNGLI